MEGTARASAKVRTERTVPPRTRVAPPPQLSTAKPTLAEFRDSLRALGNLEIQRILKSIKVPHRPNVREAGVARASSAGKSPDRAPTSPKTAAPATGRRAAAPPVRRRAETEPAEATDAVGNVSAPAARSARLDPENDPAYRTVVTQLGRTAARLKTPGKRAEEKAKEKEEEVKGASLLPPVRRQQERGYQQQMVDLGAAPIPKIEEFTIDTFMEAFKRGFEELAKQLPKASENNRAVSNAVDFSSEKAVAVRNLESQRDDKSRALRDTAARPPMDAPWAKATPAAALELTRDQSGPVPVVRNATAAAPKPIPSEDISLDDQSEALDDALTNQVAGGQTLTISEASLALPVSGEKDFDEAGEAKRKAQEAIRKLIPGYRVVEAGVLNKARSNAASLVETGLRDSHGVRHESFGAVLGHQERREKSVEGQKDVVLTEFARIYGAKKKAVDDELDALNVIGDDFQKVLTDVETGLKNWVRNNLEYIYTPGMFDYSDWIDKAKVQTDIEQELQTLRDRSRGNLPDPWMYFKALKAVQDKHAKVLFEEAKGSFLLRVMSEARTIAQRVVDALNRASQHIRDGQTDTEKIYRGLSATEQIQYSGAYAAAIGQYTSLAELVADKHRETVGDMARSYHKVARTLDATFEAIRKDVLTSSWEKAWNKIKAVVNAIIDFATRIAELLGRMVHLLGDIITSPRYFFTNLVTGIGRGLSSFVERIDTFLAEAFFDWLRGATGVSVQLPKDWDPKGIFGLFTQLLGLSVETIWQRMEVVYDKTVANAFRRGEVLLDKGLELFAIVKAEGLGGLWTHIKESLGTILSDALTSMKGTILYAAIKKVMFEIGKLLVPGGGFIAIAEKIIRLLQFIVEARDKILNLIESFVESMALAVKGDVSGIISRITGALTTFITVALDFLVTFFGLGGLKSKIERVIERMRSPVIRGIDWVLGKLKPLVMKVKGAAGAVKTRTLALLEWWRERREFKGADGKPHSLFVQGSEHSARLMVASDEREVINVLVAIIESSAPDTVKDTARRALLIFNKKLAPVISGEAKPALQQQFAANLTSLQLLLQQLVGWHPTAGSPTGQPAPGSPGPTAQAQGPHRPPFVLRLPLQKAPHLNTYRSWLGKLQSDPHYDRGAPAQLEKWHQALRLGGSDGIPASVYERGHRLGLTGTTGERRIRVPDWSRTGAPVAFEVDHIIELQVTPPGGMREEFNKVPNFELLDEAANGTSGGQIERAIEKERDAQVAADPSLVKAVLLFDQVVLDVGTTGIRWSVEEIRAGEHLDVVEEE